MADHRFPAVLPAEFRQYFWDINASDLDPNRHSHYIINRLLDKGNLRAARWVLRSFTIETIKETFRKRRDFSPWNGRFWSHYLNLSEKEVACLNPSYLNQRKQLWPY